jgi:hypothetical protein
MRIKAEEEASREGHGEPRRKTILRGLSRKSQGLLEKGMRCNVENRLDTCYPVQEILGTRRQIFIQMALVSEPHEPLAEVFFSSCLPYDKINLL